MLVACRAVGLWPGDAIMAPAAAVAVGISIVWSLGGRAPTVGGVGRARPAGRAWVSRSLVAGVASLADRTRGLAGVGASAGAIAVVVSGLAIFAAPALGRLLRRLDDERAARIREDERARMAAHLHDSVLQSLVLLQRTTDARRMTSIARRQERELRAWLYGTTHDGEPTSLHAAIDALAVGIEADHDIRVEAVVVGDQPLDAASSALVAAVREAVVNAARHADVERVDVFVEADDTELTGFVRDTGRGFDPGTVAGDRRGHQRVDRRSHPPPRRHRRAHVGAGQRHRGRAARAAEALVTVRVVLVDDHALFRAGVRAELLGLADRVEIVGEAGDVETAIDVVRDTAPDVVLLDVHMPGGGGQQVITAVRDDPTAPRFLALSVSDSAEDVIAVVRAGARGYVTKTIDATELVDAIERVHDGDAVFSPRLAGFVLDAFSGDVPAPTDPELDLLTTREQEVMRLIARGYSYKEIAGRLYLSVKTIETHVSAVLRKLQLSNRHQLTAWANERRLI